MIFKTSLLQFFICMLHNFVLQILYSCSFSYTQVKINGALKYTIYLFILLFALP